MGSICALTKSMVCARLMQCLLALGTTNSMGASFSSAIKRHIVQTAAFDGGLSSGEGEKIDFDRHTLWRVRCKKDTFKIYFGPKISLMDRKIRVLRFLLLALRVFRDATVAVNFFFLTLSARGMSGFPCFCQPVENFLFKKSTVENFRNFIGCFSFKNPARFSGSRFYGLLEIDTIVCDVVYDFPTCAQCLFPDFLSATPDVW